MEVQNALELKGASILGPQAVSFVERVILCHDRIYLESSLVEALLHTMDCPAVQ